MSLRSVTKLTHTLAGPSSWSAFRVNTPLLHSVSPFSVLVMVPQGGPELLPFIYLLLRGKNKSQSAGNRQKENDTEQRHIGLDLKLWANMIAERPNAPSWVRKLMVSLLLTKRLQVTLLQLHSKFKLLNPVNRALYKKQSKLHNLTPVYNLKNGKKWKLF